MNITPLHIELMIHIRCSCSPIPNRRAPAVTTYLGDLQEEGLIAPTNNDSGFCDTKRGRAWLNMLCSMPLPEPGFFDAQGRKINDE